MFVVFPEQVDSDENVINVPEDEGVFLGIAVLLLEKGDGVVSPMATRVEVVRSVIAIVKGEPVTLIIIRRSSLSIGSAGDNLPAHRSR